MVTLLLTSFMRLLIIEPEQSKQKYLKTQFEKACFTTDVASTLSEGSKFSRQTGYDLIITASDLPDSNGGLFYDQLRAKHKHTPIIALAKLANPSSQLYHLNGGADDFIAPPFLFEELLARSRAVLRRPPQFTADILTIDDIVVDCLGNTVCRAGQYTKLTRKEFELLVFLLRNQGIVFSRSQILEHVWDIHADIFSNTIETHILNIRKKLNYGSMRKFIITIPGRGYKVELEEESEIKFTPKLRGKVKSKDKLDQRSRTANLRQAG